MRKSNQNDPSKKEAQGKNNNPHLFSFFHFKKHKSGASLIIKSMKEELDDIQKTYEELITKFSQNQDWDPSQNISKQSELFNALSMVCFNVTSM